MSEAHFFHKGDLIQILDGCINKTLGAVDKNNVFDRTISNPKITGIPGDVVEQSVLGYPADTRQAPDLSIDGVQTELKTTGIRYSKKEKNKYEAKEPMSITAVSPHKIINENFDTSAFFHKLEHMLLVYYLYDSSTTVTASEYANFPIKGYQFFQFNDTDMAVLQKDWQLVRDFIAHLQTNYADYESQYPRLSSALRSQLLYIDTAPKWPNRPRFRLKRSVVTNIVQEHFGDSFEQLPNTYSSYAEIDSKCNALTKLYKNKTVHTLSKEFSMTGNINSKSISERIIVKMFSGNSKKMNQISLFSKIGLRGKSIVLSAAGLRTEDMKLFPIDFEELTTPDLSFENSLFYDYFSGNQILCIIFEEPAADAAFKNNKFLGFKRLSFDDYFMQQQIKPVWNEIRKLILNDELKLIPTINKKTGLPVMNAKTGIPQSSPNFPKAKDNIIFVRGSGSDSTKKPEEVNGIKMYKQYIWIKGNYLAERLSGIDFL